MTAGKTELMGRSFQSSANSHKKTDFSKYPTLNSRSFQIIQIAIGRSKLGHLFLISAGARLTVILVEGNLKPEFFIALLTLSRLSCMAVSASQTILNIGIPKAISTSTSTGLQVSQFTDTDFIVVSIFI
jgi:hypothetical protein